MLSVKGNFSWGFSEKVSKKDTEKTKADSKDSNGKKVEADSEEKKDADKTVPKKKEFGDVITLKDIDFEVRKGEFICVIGDVGSGKSSLLNSIIGDLIYVE